jgi:hypothetical protein
LVCFQVHRNVQHAVEQLDTRAVQVNQNVIASICPHHHSCSQHSRIETGAIGRYTSQAPADFSGYGRFLQASGVGWYYDGG